MINLLPPEHAASIRYGRQNRQILHWLAGMAVAIVVLILILGAGWFYINQESNSLKKEITATNQQLEAQNLKQVQADAKEITGDISVIDKVLRQEIHFSELIQTIGGYMPPGTVLGSLSLSDKVSGALDLNTNAKDYTSAAQIAINLSDPKDDLFSKVDVINISCNSGAEKVYKCSATLRALFSKDAQNRFLSVPAGSKL